MPNNPNRSQIHIDRPLTDVSIAYTQDVSNFVNEKVFPVINVGKQSDKYFTYDKGDALRVHTDVRNAGSESAGAGFDLNTENFFCDTFALHTEIADEDRDNADDPLDLDTDSTEFLTHDILMKKEMDFFAKYFKAGVWENDFTGVGATPGAGEFLQWDLTGSEPVADVKAWVRAINASTGASRKNMTLTISPDVWDVLAEHADIIDRIKHTETGILTEDIVAQVMGIKQILVAEGVVNSAAKGQTEAVDYMATPKSALLTYAPAKAGKKRPSAGYTFKWRNYNKGDSIAVRKFYIEVRESDRIEVKCAYDQKVVATDCGLFAASVIAG